MQRELNLSHCLAISLCLHFVGALVAPVLVPARTGEPPKYYRVRIVSDATPPPTVAAQPSLYAPAGLRPSSAPSGPAPGRAGREGASALAPQMTPLPFSVARRGSDRPPMPVELERARASAPGLPEAPRRGEIEVPSLAAAASRAPGEGLAVEPETERVGAGLANPPGVGLAGPPDSRGLPERPATAGEGPGLRGSPTGDPSGGRPDGTGTGERGSGHGGGSASSGSGAGSGGNTAGAGSGGTGTGTGPAQAATGPTRGPVVLSAPAMPRTREMERLEIHGQVRVRVSVSASGAVSSASLVSGAGDADVDSAAVQWVRAHWRFGPALVNGKPSAGSTVVAVRF